MAGRQKWRQEGFSSREEWTKENMRKHERGESDQWHDPALDIELPGAEILIKAREQRVAYKAKGGEGKEAALLAVLSKKPERPKTAAGVRKALAVFLASNGGNERVTFSELAIALGFDSLTALMKAMADESLPEDYRGALDNAVTLVDSLLTQRMLAIAEQKHDYKGYESALSRMDKLRGSLDKDLRPAAEVPGGTSSILALQVSIGQQDREQGASMIEDRINALVRIPGRQEKRGAKEQEPVYAALEEGSGDD